MGDKISVQQRKYFVERIETSINDKINELKQANAAQVQTISEKAYDKYLKLLKVDKDMKRFSKLYDEVARSLNFDKYAANTPAVYNSSGSEDIKKGYRYLCGKTAAKQESETPEGKLIKQLEAKKRAAVDELHGVNELDGLKITVNNILKGADVPLLGE